MNDFRDAAARALADLAPGDLTPAQEGAVKRVTVDIEVDGQVELVTLALRDGALVWTSTGGDTHVAAALRWVVADTGLTVRMTPTPAEAAEPPRVSWEPPTPEESGDDDESPRLRLADALEEVVTVIVRAGVENPDAPAIAESLERLRREAPLPTPSGLARWLGRLRQALDQDDAVLVARLLDGASELVSALRTDRPTRRARQHVVGWLGAMPELGGLERISDRTLVEVAREHLGSSERGGVERRYLVDLHNGEVFREERSRSAPVASVGPTPRVVTVGLAEVEDGPTPRRIRMMQYSVSPQVSKDELRRLESTGYRRFGALADRYRQQVAEHPGQAEPFALVVPKRWSTKGVPACFDDDGVPLPFARADDPAAVDVLRQWSSPAPRWVAGRLVDARGSLMMVPCALATPEGDSARLLRLR